MDQEAVSTLMDKWMNDEAFRTSLRKDPEGTVKATGLKLSDDQWKTLRSIDWNSPNQELAARASNSVTEG